MPSDLFHTAVAAWFTAEFSAPTEVQRQAWPAIQQRRNTLLAAPTGSGKTLAAFLAAIDALVREGEVFGLPDETRVLYVSPLKALSNDIHTNLEQPLAGIAAQLGPLSPLEIRDRCRAYAEKFIAIQAGEFQRLGVLWDKDERLRDIFLEDLREVGYLVGDNEPYSGKAPQDFTIDHHAEEIDLPHIGIEIRQDLIDDAAGVAEIAAVMHDIIASIPDRINAKDERITA